MKNFFVEVVIGFYLCYPTIRKSNGIINFSSFLKFRKMAAVIEVSCSEPPFELTTMIFLSDLPIAFAQVLIILKGLLFFNFCLVDSK